MSEIYLIGAIITALFLRKPYTYARDNEKYDKWKPLAIYIAMIILWPITWIFVAFAMWVGRHLKG
jgi:small-conductance mechanosensitive channel